ncbi:YegS/Rv2252/BmrU family lipid kinase [Nocardioides cavernaquae]|uniref:YegS/Rv2252/BmrU family lipid kinase n=1 Tax=Nocardioides cavernaquae TaxID=2321396 RepID=A0A3A5H917_9ACTN|nr:YegS/Rv2252/BmrU family lipid kinase [Nocardioides cavernaquae]RJS45875.1 YegS/Rv2252/BmrU family lipid kinase [Nocardioides cavernaquae]
MTDRPRLWLLSWAAALSGLFLILGILVTAGWSPLLDADRALSRPFADAVADHAHVITGLRWFELATGTLAAELATVAIALLLWWKGHPRAGVYFALVNAATILSVQVLKPLFDRDRPEWQIAERLLHNGSYPSGHAAWAASILGSLAVLVSMLVRKAPMRKLAYAALLLAVLAIGADRLLLGRHFVTDVAGGMLLGGFWVLVVLALYSPIPRGHAVSARPLVVSVPHGKRDLAVVLNPIKVEDLSQFRSVVTQMAIESGWSEPTWHYTTVEDPGTGQAHQAAIDGADLVLVCGGDGTVREVCTELAGTGIPVGIVPAGTGNLLGRNLSLPLYFRSAIDVALNGQDRAIDMVRISGDGVEETSFLVMAGMGFDAAIMEGVNEDIKKKVGWIAYVLSALKALMFPTMKLEVSIDDGPFTKHRARTLVVGNVGYLQGGMPLIPNASIDDGQLDVVILYPKKFLSWIPLAVRVLTKQKRSDTTITRFTGSKVVVRSAVDVPRQIDGDIIASGSELTCETVHGRLLVRVPR